VHGGELHGLLQFQRGDAELLHKDIVHCITSERALEGSEQGDLDFLDSWLCSEIF
jgi:hypothetical protein